MEKFSHRNFALKSFIIITSTFLLSGIITSIITEELIPEQFKKEVEIFSQGILQIIFLFFLTIYLSNQSPLPKRVLFRLKNNLDLKTIALIFSGILGIQAFTSGYLIIQQNLIPENFLEIYKEAESFIENMYIELLGGNSFLQFLRAILIGAIIPAISEEFFFRGLIQKSFEQEFKVLTAILFTSVLFALIHFNPVSLIPLTVIGIYLGLLAYLTQNIWIPVLAHFFNNSFAIIVLYNKELKELDDKTRHSSIIEGIVFFSIGIIIIFVTLFVIFKINHLNLNSTSKYQGNIS